LLLPPPTTLQNNSDPFFSSLTVPSGRTILIPLILSTDNPTLLKNGENPADKNTPVDGLGE
jgi:hypothetical protein